LCHNPNLGLATKAKGLQGCGPRGGLGVTLHAFGSIRKCEEVNLHTPKATAIWEMESRWTLESSKNNFMGQNSMV